MSLTCVNAGAPWPDQFQLVITEDAIRQIEEAQQRLRKAQATALEVIDRQQARLESNRQFIDSAAELPNLIYRNSPVSGGARPQAAAGALTSN